MCIQFVFWSTGQWRKDEEEVNIQRHSLTVRDTDMFSRAWQIHWKKNTVEGPRKKVDWQSSGILHCVEWGGLPGMIRL